jgi:hypothetical protein
MPQCESGTTSHKLTTVLLMMLFATPSICAGLPAKISSPLPDPWITVKDKTGACQMSVPGDWKPEPQLLGHVVSPEHTESMLISGFKRDHHPMSESTQKAVQVDKMFENSADRWFYVSKPILGTDGKPNLVVYHVDVARPDGTCVAQILVNQNHSEEEIKKIADSVAVTK